MSEPLSKCTRIGAPTTTTTGTATGIATATPGGVAAAVAGLPPWIVAMIGTISSATMLMILISGLTAGPAVSLYGSPTVSPVTAALWASDPLPP